MPKGIIFDYAAIGKGLQNRWIPVRKDEPKPSDKVQLCDQSYGANRDRCPGHGVCMLARKTGIVCHDFGKGPR